MKPNGIGPGMALPESQVVVQPQQSNGVREREAATDNHRLKRRPSSGSLINDGNTGLPVMQNSSNATVLGGQNGPGKDALSFAAVLRSRNKISGMFISLFLILILLFLLSLDMVSVGRTHPNKLLCVKLPGLARSVIFYEQWYWLGSFTVRYLIYDTHCEKYFMMLKPV